MSNRSSVLRHAWTVGVVLALAMVPAVAAHGAPSPDARRVTATADVWSSVSVASDRAGVASHTCAIRVDSSLWCWGRNDVGQLGAGDRHTRYRPHRVGDDADWQTVSTGWRESCGIRAPGALYCWGLGHGSVPVQVGVAVSWTSVSVGHGFRCGLQDDGSLWCWGHNDHGQLGLGDTTDRDDPTMVGAETTWSSVSSGDVHACAVRADASLWCWGQGLDGQLGLGDVDFEVHAPTQVQADLDWSTVSAGTTLTCGVRTDQAAFCWGKNDHGQLGIGSHDEQTTPAKVASDESWAQISAGVEHTCATSTVGTLWCWGANGDGQLGIGSTAHTLIPAQVGSADSWATPDTGGIDSCAPQTDHTLWCWGSPESGELGVGSRTSATDAPVQVGLPEPPPSARRLNAVDARTSSDVWAVGDQDVGASTKTLIEHFDGVSWTKVKSPSPGATVNALYGVTALAADDAWAVGSADGSGEIDTLVLHWNGTTWARVASPNKTPYDNRLTSVVAIAPDDVWAAGWNRQYYNDPLMEHWDGSTWTMVPVDTTTYSYVGFASLSALATDDVWAVGSGFQDEEAGVATITEHWDGTAWTIERTTHHNRFADHHLRAVTAIAHDIVWAVGDELSAGRALIQHWTGAWKKLGPKVPQVGGMELDAAASTGAHDVWAAGKAGGYGLVLHWDGATWNLVDAVKPPGSQFLGATAISKSDAWLVGHKSTKALAEHWDGSTWTVVPVD